MEMVDEKGLNKVGNSVRNPVYLVTMVTKCRKLVFDDLFVARIVINALKEEQVGINAETLAFVLMPDHLHWLIQLENGKQLSDIVSTIKSVSDQRISRKIWQNGYHEHALYGEEDIQHMAKYIVENPLRAGLVQKVSDYPHWDSKWL